MCILVPLFLGQYNVQAFLLLYKEEIIGFNPVPLSKNLVTYLFWWLSGITSRNQLISPENESKQGLK